MKIRISAIIIFYISIFCALDLYVQECQGDEELFKTVEEYLVKQPPHPSQFSHLVMVETPPKFKCPANESIILDKVPQHGEPFECGGHVFIISGNAVYIKN